MQEEFALNALHVQNTITSAGPRSNRCSASNVLFFFSSSSSSSKKIKLFYTKHKKKEPFGFIPWKQAATGLNENLDVRLFL